MWLSWSAAAVAAAILGVVGLACRRAKSRVPSAAGAVAKETAIILALYAFWQKSSDFAVSRSGGAVDNALWVQRVERLMRLPSEASWQRWTLPHPLLVQALNAYYAVVHVPALIAFLVWLYFRHRDHYAKWRNIGAFMTGVSLIIQMIPVAPPRLMPGLGFIDTAVVYKQSVYGTGGIKIGPQLAAMPSVHVAWAVLIATAVIVASTSRWRWWILLHPALTTFAVVAT
ncbi:MAG: phosphatase PAP2 family protein, partial [Acidimicrobiales bacterium]